MRLKQLELILALEKYGTYVNAANKVGMSQSSVSTAIKELEKEVGFKIVNRSKSGITFTNKGKIVLVQAHEIEAELKDILSIKDIYTGEIAGQYFIAGASHSCNLLITDMVINLQKEYPKLMIGFEDKDNFEILEGVVSGKYLAGVLQFSSIDEILYQSEFVRHNLGFQKLFEEQMVFCVGPKHPLYGRKEALLKEILEHSVVITRYRMSEIFESFFEQHGYEKSITLIHDLFTTRVLVEKSDHYVSFMPYSFAQESVCNYKDNLKILKISDFNWLATIGWVYKQEKLSWNEQQIFQVLKNQWTFDNEC